MPGQGKAIRQGGGTFSEVQRSMVVLRDKNGTVTVEIYSWEYRGQKVRILGRRVGLGEII